MSDPGHLAIVFILRIYVFRKRFNLDSAIPEPVKIMEQLRVSLSVKLDSDLMRLYDLSDKRLNLRPVEVVLLRSRSKIKRRDNPQLPLNFKKLINAPK